MGARLVRITASGLVKAGPCVLKSVHLVAGSATATLGVQDTSAGGGSDILALGAVTGAGDSWTSGDGRGVPFSAGIYATLSGTGASASFEIEP
jgi:hypothetical protein